MNKMVVVEATKETKADENILCFFFYKVTFIIFLIQSHDPRTKIWMMPPFYNEYSNRMVDLRRILMELRLSNSQL